jgi:hypothetical protein
VASSIGFDDLDIVAPTEPTVDDDGVARCHR